MTKEQQAAAENEDHMLLMVSRLKHRLEKIHLGGGKRGIVKQHEKGKMTARERVDALIDEETEFLEFGAFAGFDMYEEYGGCPAGGVVTGYGRVQGRLCVIVANDATVKAGAWFPITGRKNLRAQEIAMENRVPIIYLVDSAGVFLPLQDQIFPDKEHFGRIFRNNAHMSAMGVPQIAAVMGSCVAGGAYLPIMSDESLIVEGTGSIFLAGPYLVRAAIGEKVDAEDLGGANMHSSLSGVIDYKCVDDTDCLLKIRDLVGRMPDEPVTAFNRTAAEPAPGGDNGILQVLPEDRAKPYKGRDLINRIADGGQFTEFKEEYGQTLLCGYARIEGWSVGIIANNREVVKSGKGEMQFGGVIYSDSADKAARFIMICNQKKIPLVFLHDVSGFMVGSRSEQGGIIKDGAKMVNAMANSVVPKFSIVCGNSYGAGNYAMCGRAYDPRLMLSWPTARLAVMGGSQAAKVLLQIQVSSQKKKGEVVSQADEDELLKKITERYTDQASPYYAAARLWVDEIIDPRATRSWISAGIEAASYAPVGEFKMGVLQT
ncbi:acyl-CoA carboxylase subunit beta [Neolewinella antarctica]|uniref:Acetyl-CoA carboxylase carboxyltransferase component n=1 Tax=Neolewinella antarctica TaxID=442734 RepID=A0ABX0X712_9BACT|nr:acyl-CoA carboxylase subunit beta [Neolewinella antarctica]NJC24786.1 acetyl-CoA carboxylase carboxyltransferase component [Neolewinella antarctica]